ncbi:MAG: hypothetical protein AAGE05_02795 [Pseudomonadota bacterium]
MQSTITLLGASLAALSLAGCATIMRGTNEDFEIVSDPAGATASLSNGESCVTPCELHLKRREPFSVEFTLDGYQPLVAEVASEFNGGAAVAGNAIFGGIIGAGVDASNGSLNNLVPNPLMVTLVPLSAAGAAAVIEGDDTARGAAMESETPAEDMDGEASPPDIAEQEIAEDMGETAEDGAADDMPDDTPEE